MTYLPESGSWAAPLPDLSQPAINHIIRIGGHRFRIAISTVQRDVPRERDTDLVRVQPWPAGYRSCLSVTGDIDAVTLFDFARRMKEF